MKKFQRTIEDFTCGHCGQQVQGDGYTNHCPGCLWSRHVDLNPGDRAATCRGLMEPVGVEVKTSGYIVIHRCRSCGVVKKNKAAAADNFEKLVEIARASG